MSKKKKVQKIKVRKRSKKSQVSTVIIPSTRLLTVGVHKIQDSQTCDRFYFWRWVMNLVSKKMNLNFWYGSIIHKGCELVPEEKPLPEIIQAMEKEDRKQRKMYNIPAEILDELDLQLEMLKIIMEVFYDIHGKRFRKLKVQDTEVRFKLKLSNSPVIFVGTIDAICVPVKKAITLVEYKTSSQVTAEYFKRLKFDKQCNGYAIGTRGIKGQLPKNCIYFTFRKPSIRVRATETPDLYLERLRDDLYERCDWYYIDYIHRFGKQSVDDVLQDIEGAAFDLHLKYDYTGVEPLLNPANWPRNDRACFNYGVCQFFPLCSNCNRYKLFLPLYQMREIRYEEEHDELNAKHKFNTKPTSKIKI